MNVPRDGLDRFRPLTPDEKGRIYQEIVNNCELHTATSCWAWRGVRSPKGYALKYIQGQMRTVSRFMLCYTTRESLNFPMDACHKEHCPIRWCVNSDHLAQEAQGEGEGRSIRAVMECYVVTQSFREVRVLRRNTVVLMTSERV